MTADADYRKLDHFICEQNTVANKNIYSVASFWMEVRKKHFILANNFWILYFSQIDVFSAIKMKTN